MSSLIPRLTNSQRIDDRVLVCPHVGGTRVERDVVAVALPLPTLSTRTGARSSDWNAALVRSMVALPHVAFERYGHVAVRLRLPDVAVLCRP